MVDVSLTEWVAVGSLVVNVGMAFVNLRISNEMSKLEGRMKEDLRQVELFMRDHFVRKETFDKVVDMMSTQVQVQFERLFAEVARLHERLDTRLGVSQDHRNHSS